MTVLLTLIMLNLRLCSFTNQPWTCAVTTLPARLPLRRRGRRIYGKFLKEIISENNSYHFDTLYYTQPSCIHKVDYKSIIDELWRTTLDEHDKQLDTVIKKLIANINYGLLEKGGATDQKSLLFQNLNEAVHYQTEYGGKIHRLTEMEGKEEYENCSPSNETDKKIYSVLNLKDKAQLKNGFKYIKEFYYNTIILE